MRSMPCSVRYRPAGAVALIAPAGEMWSVVTESPSLARTLAPLMSCDRRRLGGHAVEVRRAADVGGVRGPLERVALRDLQAAPVVVALEHVGVVGGEHLSADGARDDTADLVG